MVHRKDHGIEDIAGDTGTAAALFGSELTSRIALVAVAARRVAVMVRSNSGFGYRVCACACIHCDGDGDASGVL